MPLLFLAGHILVIIIISIIITSRIVQNSTKLLCSSLLLLLFLIQQSHSIPSLNLYSLLWDEKNLKHIERVVI